VLGHCWAFAGERGNATIQLPRRINPSAFSLDHVARGVARDFRSAPQHFKVWVRSLSPINIINLLFIINIVNNKQ
jgi:hypothetical protein